jgi:hypothetical protein
MADKPELMNLDEAVDQEWSRTAEELEWRAEFIVEWGVQFSRPYGSHVSEYGDGEEAERQAREFAATAVPRGDQKISVVARRVITGPWQDRPEVA